MFAVDCVLCRTVSQLFACVLVPCVSNRCEQTVTVICPEVTLCGWRDIQIQELNNLNMCNGPVLIWWMKYVSIYRICMRITHCATYEWLQNSETKEPIRRDWCKILKKARTPNPSATTMVAQWKMSFLWKDSNTRKQHVENISHMYDKNSWGFCQRNNQKKTRSAHPFEGVRHWLGMLEKHITMPPVGEITLERMTDTRKPSKTLKPLKSKLPTRPYISVHRSVCYGQNRLEIKRLQR